MRVSVLVLSGFVLCYAITMQGMPIYELVSSAYQITLVGAFVPLAFGLYWKRASTQGAVLFIVLGVATWMLFIWATSWSEVLPANKKGEVHHYASSGLHALILAGSDAYCTVTLPRVHE